MPSAALDSSTCCRPEQVARSRNRRRGMTSAWALRDHADNRLIHREQPSTWALYVYNRDADSISADPPVHEPSARSPPTDEQKHDSATRGSWLARFRDSPASTATLHMASTYAYDAIQVFASLSVSRRRRRNYGSGR